MPRLYGFGITCPSFCVIYDFGYGCYIHREASVIYMVDILLRYPIFFNSIMEALLLPSNKLWIFTFGTLIVIPWAVFGGELCMVLHIPSHPMLTHIGSLGG